MGIVIRKVLNRGPFRINLSKHGIGFSIGCKVGRLTFGSNGINRTTYTIPGKGISYIKTTKRNKK